MAGTSHQAGVWAAAEKSIAVSVVLTASRAE